MQLFVKNDKGIDLLRLLLLSFIRKILDKEGGMGLEKWFEDKFNKQGGVKLLKLLGIFFGKVLLWWMLIVFFGRDFVRLLCERFRFFKLVKKFVNGFEM